MYRILVIFIIGFSSLIKVSAQDVKFNLSYFQQKEELTSIDNILNVTFSEMPVSQSLGFRNGTYWFKLSIVEASNSHSHIAYIPTHNISRIELYAVIHTKLEYVAQSGNSIAQEDLNVDYKFPAFRLENLDQAKPTYFLKVEFPKEANFPLKIISENHFLKDAIFNQSIIFLYYGTCLMIFLINVFLYFKFRNRIFIYYSVFLFSMMGGMLLYDGTLIHLQRIVPYSKYFEFGFRLLECVTLILFSIHFLELRLRTPKFVKATILFPLLMVVSYIIFSMTNNYMYIAIGDVIAISVFFVLWILGFKYMKKLDYAKFFVLGYALILPIGIFYFVGYGFGLWRIDGENVVVKIAGWLDMAVFTYALTYRMKVREDESVEMISALRTHLNEMKISFNEKSNAIDPYFIFLKKNEVTTDPLTVREIEVLKCINEGITNPKIGEKLFISTNTVKTHVRNVYNKLDIKNRNELKLKISEVVK